MQAPTEQGFYRGTNRIIAGVCSGIAEGIHVNPIWIRLAFVVLAFVQGIGLVLYVILWVVMPEQGRPATVKNALDSLAADMRRAWDNFRHESRGPAPASPSTPPAPESSSAPQPPQTVAAPTSPPPPLAAMPASTPASTEPAQQNWYWLLGIILVVVGLVYLVINSGLLDWSVIWPALLIGLGVLLLVRNMQRRL